MIRFPKRPATVAWLVAVAAVLTLAQASSARRAPKAAKPVAVDSLAWVHAWVDSARNVLERDDGEQGLALARQAEAWLERRTPSEPLLLAAARTHAALGLMLLGDYADGLAASRRSLDVLDTNPAPDSILLVTALNTRGRLHYLLQDPKESRRFLLRALEICERIYPAGHSRTRVVLNNIANTYTAEDDLEGARPMYEQLVREAEAANPPDSAQLGIALQNFANVVTDLGDHAAGWPLYERALAIRLRLYGPRSGRVGMTLQNMASLAEVSGDLPREEALVRRAREAFLVSVGPSHPGTAEITVNHGDVLWRLGRVDEAFAMAMLGERLTREHLRRTAQGLGEAHAVRYETTRLAGLSLGLTIAALTPGDTVRIREVFDAAIRSRCLVLDEMTLRGRWFAERGDSTVQRLRRTWEDARSRFAALALRTASAGDDPRFKASLEEARRAADTIEAELAQRHRAFGRHESAARAGYAEVRGALPAHTALVRFVLHERTPKVSRGPSVAAYSALIMPADGAPPVVLPLAVDTLVDSLVRGWRDAMTRPDSVRSGRVRERDYRRVAGELRRQVWDPLLPHLAGASRVLLVADGALQTVAFATLPVGADRYLADVGPTLHDLSAERDVLPETRDGARERSLLVFGGVDFDGRDDASAESPVATAEAETYRGALPSCMDLRTTTFPPLPNSGPEAQEMATAWRARNGAALATVRLGMEASEGRFKREAPRARFVHVATHGFFVDPECPSADGEDEHGGALLRSGLVFAGANRHAPSTASRDDGLLTADEVTAMNLFGVDWVVLSACETGLGRVVSSEGVFGLRRAFRAAGAGTLIMSLWKVPDAATRRWMRELYAARFDRGLDTAEAVRAASRAELARLRSRRESTLPGRWGAFIASGDWR